MTKIKDLDKYQRPREKLFRYGVGKLNNEELLALILGSGVKGVNVKVLAKRILKLNTEKKDELDLKDLQKIKGLGPAKSAQVLAVLELGKRLFLNKRSQLILSPEDVWQRCEDFRNSKKEYFVIFFLDTRNQEIKREIISIGTLNASLVHPREVFEPAIRHNVASIVLVHNHPTGDCSPSEDDIEVTNRLVEAGKLLGIKVRDHVVVSNDGWISLKVLKLI